MNPGNASNGIAGPFFRALFDARSLVELEPGVLDRVLRMARRTGVLARLALCVEQAGIEHELPAKAVELLGAARPVAEHHERSIRLEVNRIRRALLGSGQGIILLKGAAYVLAGLPAGKGRLVSDVDILVPKNRLEPVERALAAAGWKTMKLNAYDQRYYRQWMHELPPLRHETRLSVLDVHHTILPETARLHPNTDGLFRAAVSLQDDLAVLSAEDMVLHSATHLFADGDIAGGVRDLVDLDALLRHFGETRAGFWDRLVPRAIEHELVRPLFYTLRFCHGLLHTPIPDEVIRAAEKGKPPAPALKLMDALCARALTPRGESRGWRTGFAVWLLYVRSHWLRMPPALLARHLAVKALRRRGSEAESQ